MNKIAKITATMLLAVLSLAAQAQVSVSAKLDSMRIPLGGQTTLRVGVEAPEGTAVKIPRLRVGSEIVPGVRIVDVPQADVKTSGSTTTTVQPYVLTSFEPRTYSLPQLKVVAGGKTYTTNRLTMQVDSVELDKANPQKTFPPKDIQDNPFSWADWWLPILLIVVAAALAVIVARLLRRLKANKPLRTHVRMVEVVPPHTKAMKRIKELQAQQIADSKDYYTQLTEVLRRYISERFGFNAMEMTTDQIVDRLRSEQDKSKTDELVEVFRTADLAKFAKYSTPGSENQYNLDSVVRFIDQTKDNTETHTVRVEDAADTQQQLLQHSRRLMKAGVAAAAVVAVALVVWAAVIVADLLI